LLKPIQQKYAPKLKLEHAVREAVKLRTEWEDIKKQVGELKSQRSRHVIARNEALRRLDDFFNRYGRPEGTTEQALAALQAQSSGPYVPDGSENSAFLISFLGRYAPDANISDPRRALQQIRSAWDRLQHLRTKTAHDPNDGVAEDQYRARLQEADACIERLENDVREATQRLETARNARVTAAELNERHNAVREQLTAAVRKRELLDRTLHWMQEAQDQLSVQYLIPMRARFLDYFRQMFDASANHLSIDPDLNIVWTQAGGERPISCFSDGTRSSAEVCVRLAMIDLLFRKERPVLILDDPFVYLDDDRLTRAMQVLSALGKDTQILYFTCHPSRQSGLDENV
jgi:DNA repair exonuclease SbcCD ATPase subunit